MKLKLLRRLLKMSKLTLYAFGINVMLFSTIYATGDLNAQSVKSIREVSIHLALKNAKLVDVFKSIEAQTSYQFTYRSEDLNQEVRITKEFNNWSIADILLEISRQSNLRFRQVNDNIHVSRKHLRRKPIVEVEINQDISVSGRVISDEDGEALPGVNVIIKGSSQGTVTDVNGYFKINVPSRETVLVFSSVGFAQEEITVGNKTVIDLTLSPDIKSLNEIVVVGYGEQKKSDLTGSISSVSHDDFNQGIVTNPEELIQGKAAGVQITQRSGDPNATTVVNIRGVGSLREGSSPLYVVDGVPLSGNADFLNPQDIKSIDVLKDASATAIYGSRAANGVILISTMKGQSGKPTLTYEGYMSVSNPERELDLLDAQEFIDFQNNYGNPASIYSNGHSYQLARPNFSHCLFARPYVVLWRGHR